jgi:hypothetical protein
MMLFSGSQSSRGLLTIAERTLVQAEQQQVRETYPLDPTQILEVVLVVQKLPYLCSSDSRQGARSLTCRPGKSWNTQNSPRESHHG